MTDILVHSIGELVVGPDANGGIDSRDDAALAIEDGEIVAIGDSETLCRDRPPELAETTIDAGEKLVLPGFVDAHTHAVFAGDRTDEYLARIAGQSYTDIHDAGGGIVATVDAVRSASEDELLDNLLTQLDVMLRHGTTTAEIKSGYGLDAETECKLLRTIARAHDSHPIDLVATYMGAHAVPDSMETAAYVDRVIEDQLPTVADQGIATFCDVFCEEGVFDIDQSRRILQAGREHGLEPKLHAEEFTRIGGAQLAADLDATSADHLLHATDEDAGALTAAGVTPVLLPATAFSLNEEYADAVLFSEAGAAVALGTDLNPSCFVHNMGFVVSLACTKMGMPPADAILGATAHAAKAIGLDDVSDPQQAFAGDASSMSATPGIGRLEVGTAANLTMFDFPDHVHLPYNGGTNRVETVIKGGKVVVEHGTLDSSTIRQEGTS